MVDHLVLMSGHPSAATSLPRLVPVLGDAGAARLQRRLLEHAAQVARAWRDTRPQRQVTVACQGAAAGEFRSWLGDDLDYEGDSGGSPGARMAVASVRAFSRGADRVVLMGVKCPDLDTVHLESAFFALDHMDCVIGPGHAGRYYLIGLVAPASAVFAGIPWGTGAVLGRTLAAAREQELRIGLLPTLPMLHGPGDLIHGAHLISEPVTRRAISAQN
ncbi:MAG: glycosyltransferase [Candidatus Krumholzibacteriia bacterium]